MRKSSNPRNTIEKVTNIKVYRCDNAVDISFEHPLYNGLLFEMRIEEHKVTRYGYDTLKDVGLSKRKKQYAMKWLEAYKQDLLSFFANEYEETMFLLLMAE